MDQKPDLIPVPPSHGLEDEGLCAADWISFSLGRAGWYESLAKRIAGVCPSVPRRVLEIGCGSGLLLKELGRLWPSPVSLTGLESDPGLLNWCRENVRAANIAFAASSHPASFSLPGAYDLVLGVNVCHHFNDPGEYFRWAGALLAPGGTLYNLDINPLSVYAFLLANSPLHINPRMHAAYVHSYRASQGKGRLEQSIRKAEGLSYAIRRRRPGLLEVIARKIGTET